MDNIILFFGENAFEIHQKVSTWQREFIKKHGDLNLIILDGKKLKARDLYEQTNQLPFLGDKKLIIVKGFLENSSDHQKEFLEYIEKIADFSILLFVETKMPDKRLSFYKYLLKKCRTDEFKNKDGALLINWITDFAKERGAAISYATARHLIDVVGNDMYALSQEIEKLTLYKLNGEILKNDIDLLSTAKLSYDVFKLTDAISTKNPKKALEILHELKEFNQELPMIFHMIVRQFRILIQIRDCIAKNMTLKETQNTLKEHPFVIKNGYSQAENFKQEDLKILYKNLLKIEKDFKTGHIKISVNDHSEFELALEKMIVAHC